MSYDIRLVNTWGKDVGLSTSTGFDGRVRDASKTYAKLRRKYQTEGNDGNVIPCVEIAEAAADILLEAVKADADVRDYLNSMVKVCLRYRHKSRGLIFN